MHAQFKLEELHGTGGVGGVAPSVIESAQWYEKASGQGFAPAQRTMGSFYYQGRGVEQSPMKAAQWYQKAAEQGDPESQYFLALQLTV